MDTNTPRPLSEVRDEAVRLLRAIVNPSPGADGTHLRREAARTLVEARQHFTTREGDPDWSGRTGAYHAFASEVFAAAGVPRDQTATLQAAIRYHTGAVVRSLLAGDDLRAAGYTTRQTPRERSAERRRARTEAIALLESGGPLEGADAARALGMVAVVLVRVSPAALAALPPAERVPALATVRTIVTHAAALLAADVG